MSEARGIGVIARGIGVRVWVEAWRSRGQYKGREAENDQPVRFVEVKTAGRVPDAGGRLDELCS